MLRKIPMRKCLGCMTSKPKKELIRIVKLSDGKVAIDRQGKKEGRGAYFCDNKECLESLIKSKRLEKEFEITITKEDYNNLLNEFEKE
jgi:predicted RNA-binding protein YlxR (DUF448 family)